MYNRIAYIQLFNHLNVVVFILFVEEALGFATKRRSRLRRSAVGNIEKARSRTLKMTLVIGNYHVFKRKQDHFPCS